MSSSNHNNNNHNNSIGESRCLTSRILATFLHNRIDFHETVHQLKQLQMQFQPLPTTNRTTTATNTTYHDEQEEEEEETAEDYWRRQKIHQENHEQNCQFTILLTTILHTYSTNREENLDILWTSLQSRMRMVEDGGKGKHKHKHKHSSTNNMEQDVEWLYPFRSLFVHDSKKDDEYDQNGCLSPTIENILPLSSVTSSSSLCTEEEILHTLCTLPSHLYEYYHELHHTSSNTTTTNTTRRKVARMTMTNPTNNHEKRKKTKREWLSIHLQSWESVSICLGYMLSHILVQLEYSQKQQPPSSQTKHLSSSHLHWNDVYKVIQETCIQGDNRNHPSFWNGSMKGESSFYIGVLSFLLDCMVYSSDYYMNMEEDEIMEDKSSIRYCVIPICKKIALKNNEGDDDDDHIENNDDMLVFMEGVNVAFVTDMLIDKGYVIVFCLSCSCFLFFFFSYCIYFRCKLLFRRNTYKTLWKIVTIWK